ncbi:MAG: HU family DNA-binding protein [Francisellaceae bacterium]|nr:HU family DNA-binding protein [Francisellaceae bacterium]MBT6207208.1 HU family DNA-binding protein [Francisellaceae bacterium]MBT6539158.1 HU family DNA-binding protein [Francisellaceae bacterium]
MNKAQLIDSVALKTDLPKKVAGRALDALLESITEALVQDDNVSIVGFGTYHVKERAARVGRNPKTGEEIKIKAARVPAFKPGKLLKEAVEQGTLVEEETE